MTENQLVEVLDFKIPSLDDLYVNRLNKHGLILF